MTSTKLWKGTKCGGGGWDSSSCFKLLPSHNASKEGTKEGSAQRPSREPPFQCSALCASSFFCDYKFYQCHLDFFPFFCHCLDFTLLLEKVFLLLYQYSISILAFTSPTYTQVLDYRPNNKTEKIWLEMPSSNFLSLCIIQSSWPWL